MHKLLVRAVAVLGVTAAATLALAAPAQAHPEVLVLCEPASNSRHMCAVFIEGEAPPVTIKWYVDGQYVASLDNRISWVRGCARGQRVTAKAVVTDPNGSDSDSDSVICGATPN